MGRPERLQGRNGSVWHAYLAGSTQEAIAEQLGITQSRVSKIIAEVRNSIPGPVIEDIRQLEAERIERLYAETMRIIEADHPLVSVQRGCVILDPDTGERLQDAGPVLAGIATALRIHERVAKAYGLDAPDKLDATITGDGSADAAWLAIVTAERQRRTEVRAQLDEQDPE